MRFRAAVLAALCLFVPCARTADKLTADLIAAAQAGDAEQVQTLIAAGVKINATGKDGLTPLLAAVTKDHSDIVKILADHGAQVDTRDGRNATPLFLAAREATTRLCRPCWLPARL